MYIFESKYNAIVRQNLKYIHPYIYIYYIIAFISIYARTTIYTLLPRIPIFPNKGNLSSVEARHYRTYIQCIAASRSISPVCSTSERRKRFYESRDNNTIML